MLKINMAVDDHELTLYVELKPTSSQKSCRACGSPGWTGNTWDALVVEAVEEGVKLDLSANIVQSAADQVSSVVQKHVLCEPCGNASLCRPWPDSWVVRSTD